MAPDRPVIAIVGAGFCGTVMAVRLLQQTAAARLDIALINRPSLGGVAKHSRSMARGLAYGTNSADHLLNVPAGRMSAFDEIPHDFEDYLKENGQPSAGGSFVARHFYGNYLQARLKSVMQAAATTPGGSTLATHHATVTALTRRTDGRFSLTLVHETGEETLVADRVVLALGNFLPANPTIANPGLYQAPEYLRDPWQDDGLAKLDIGEPILLIGSGLTMFDVAMSLKRRASLTNKPLELVAISRRGLLPQPHRTHLQTPDFLNAPPDIGRFPTARHYLQSVRRQVRDVVAEGGDWRDVVASLRPLTPQLWSALSITERQRFFRHLRPYWESHRHRAAPQAATILSGMLASGELRVHAANLVNLQQSETGIVATIRERGSSDLTLIHVGGVVNCTGPTSNLHAEPLLAALQKDGNISADPLAIGLNVAEDYRVLNCVGLPWDGVYYVGPLLKAQRWEATAVPELRVHVAAAAAAVCNSLATSLA